MAYCPNIKAQPCFQAAVLRLRPSCFGMSELNKMGEVLTKTERNKRKNTQNILLDKWNHLFWGISATEEQEEEEEVRNILNEK